MLLCVCCLYGFAQSTADSSETAFRKGRWLLGLSGSVSSGSVQSDSASAAGYTIEYSLRLNGARFIADQWALGGFIRGERNTPARFNDRETEVLLFGPSATWYMSKAKAGSTFLSIGFGYSRFRDDFESIQMGQVNRELTTGQGVGVVGTIGYAVVIADRISFELGLDSSTNWIWAERSITGRPPFDENLRVGEVAFSFGFKVLL